MVDQVSLYLSAALDLEFERELLARAVTEIPVTLGWNIVMTPRRGDPPDLQEAASADVHILLLAGDIRAPVGLEWYVARRAGRMPVTFLKRGALRTPAAEAFTRQIESQATWRPFKDTADLRRQVLLLLADHILDKALHYALRPEELENLQSWRKEIESAGATPVEEMRGGAGDSSVILSTERYIPSEGVLIQPPQAGRDPSED